MAAEIEEKPGTEIRIVPAEKVEQDPVAAQK